MPISEAGFDNEQELQDWAYTNLGQFLPNCILTPGFRITTNSGKGGVPDGFAFNLSGRAWYVIECELLRHGVWPHIAEQITRFVVALQNKDTLRLIRDRLFEHIDSEGLIEEASNSLETTSTRLHQQLELFIESVQPSLIILIDETSQDLSDMAHALDISTRTFRIKKFNVDGHFECYSPDANTPAIETEPQDIRQTPSDNFDVIEILGGGSLHQSTGRFKCYALTDSSVVYIKNSRRYSNLQQAYWYGFGTASLRYIEEAGVTHIVLVMGDQGFAKLPTSLIQEYLQTTKTSQNPDGSVRHYHCMISEDPELRLYTNQGTDNPSITEFFQTFN